ncbi:MAG TPA: fibronectin type III domain-containing protein [Nocardioidaceae bacterium]|nr:fibronectin type III domain-containing protein [Nocardioidaceae bacterium]
MTVRRGRGALAWLPVLCLLLISLASPGHSAPTIAGSLTVTPNEFYGGEALTFKGQLGTSGTRTIWLEFNMNRPGDLWTRIDGFTTSTKADGSFEFTHPARSALNISLRVGANGTATPFETLNAHDQELAVSVVPDDAGLGATLLHPSRYRTYTRYAAVAGESMLIRVDTSPMGTPILFGRTVTLQRRINGNKWLTIGTDTVDHAGFAEFQFTLPASGLNVYRAVQERWTDGGAQVGWFPSFPTFVDLLHRPAPIDLLSIPGTGPITLNLSWTLPSDPEVDRVWVAWKPGNTAPTTLQDATQKISLPGVATAYTAGSLEPSTHYSFAVFTRTSDGVLSARTIVTDKTDPPPIPDPVTNLVLSSKSDTHVTLGWNPTSGLGVNGVVITRVDGNGPAAAPGSGAPQWNLGPTVSTFTDNIVQPSTTYTYGVYMRNKWGVYSPAESITVTTEAP